MKEKQVVIPFKEYDGIEELSSSEKELVKYAKAQWGNAYAPYSHFLVGAAVLLEDGNMVGGSNQENAAYAMCLCAERSALATAASVHPGKKVTSLAVASKHLDKGLEIPAAPCGACRQVISETEDRSRTSMYILLALETGKIYRFEKGKDLLPFAFGGSYLT